MCLEALTKFDTRQVTKISIAVEYLILQGTGIMCLLVLLGMNHLTKCMYDYTQTQELICSCRTS